jgi:hypothetical protein
MRRPKELQMDFRWIPGLLVTTLLFGAGCGPDDKDDGPAYEVSSGNLTGTIAGEQFAFVSGFATDLFGDGEYWIELHGSETEDPCNTFGYEDEPHVIISTSPEAKDIDLGLTNNITFAYPSGDTSENDVSTTGRLIIDEVSEESVSGGLYARFEDHEVDGHFTVPFCPDE